MDGESRLDRYKRVLQSGRKFKKNQSEAAATQDAKDMMSADDRINAMDQARLKKLKAAAASDANSIMSLKPGDTINSKSRGR